MSATTTNTAESGHGSAPSAGKDVAASVFGRLATGPGIAFVGVLLVAYVGLFWRWFERQHLFSLSKLEDWGHAYLIPVICLYLVWQRREELSRVTFGAFWPGLVPVLVGIAGYFYAVVGIRSHMVEGLFVILTVFGLTLLLLGPQAMRLLFLPIAFLAFGVTLSERVMIEITFQLQLLASQGSWVMLGVLGALFGFSIDLDGNTLLVVTGEGVEYPLNVAEACSGMRMVVAFYALGGAAALVGCTQWWQRIALLLLAGPVALLMNMVRVTVLGLLTLVDPDLAAGNAHTLIGTILLVPSLALFLGVVWALNRAVETPDGGRDDGPAAAESPANGGAS
ncbi:MAG: exosortase/archaeosortase family protein [Planctomycetota bacterium]